jgi:hypothetical protein
MNIEKKSFFFEIILHELEQENILHRDRLDMLVQDNILAHRVDIDDE